MARTLEAIKEIIKIKGVTQRDLAKQIGASESSVSKWLKGTRHPNIEEVEKILNALGCNVIIKRKTMGGAAIWEL